jgi:hypothetical protein
MGGLGIEDVDRATRDRGEPRRAAADTRSLLVNHIQTLPA